MEDTLQHFGIRGMHWGVRRFESENGKLTAAGKNRYNKDENGDYEKIGKKGAAKSSESDSEGEKKKGLSDKQKKAIIVGAAVAGTALAAYGGYKLHQLNKEATAGLKRQYKYEFKNIQSKANEKKVSAKQWENLADRAKELGKMENFSTSMQYANSNRISAQELQSQADALQAMMNRNRYSMKEKVKYLKNN